MIISTIQATSVIRLTSIEINGPQAEAVESRAKDSEAQDHTNDEQDAEDHDRLRGMEAHEGPLVDEQKDDSGQPAEQVAEQAGDVFL